MSEVTEVKSETVLNVNWVEIDQLLTSKKFKLSTYAKQNNLNETDFRAAVVEHYGNRIVFKRGRNGGTFWAN